MGEEHSLKPVLNGVHCPSCRTSYSLVKFLGRQGKFYKVLVHCCTCDTYGIGTAYISEQTTSFVPPPPPITEEEVLAMREFLQNFDGDFRRLFGCDQHLEDSNESGDPKQAGDLY